MQVARNFFLSSEKTYTRKIYEMLLAYKIERALTKDQILELYMNQIYLGQRAYGFAAPRVYFGKDLKDITLAEAAMLAGCRRRRRRTTRSSIRSARRCVRSTSSAHARARLHHAAAVRPGREGGDPRAHAGQPVRGARRIRRRDGAADDVRAVQG
jgi:membrane peptidoglycan carboxypeptidase